MSQSFELNLRLLIDSYVIESIAVAMMFKSPPSRATRTLESQVQIPLRAFDL
jgi:hypothetical protein